MKTKNRCIALMSATCMLVLIFDGKTALRGAAEGISLCVATLIPSLFPFFILSITLTKALSGQAISILRPIAAACKIPKGSESLLAISMLGGYPVGAQNVALMYRQGNLTHSQAMRMLPFCNNAGPAFIFGVLASLFSSRFTPWLLWMIHIASALLVGIILPDKERTKTTQSVPQQVRITDALSQAVKAMAQVCGWVVLMRILLTFLERWFLWFFPTTIQVLLSGILELSNGCILLKTINSEGLRFLIASVLLSLGGICVTLQTASVAEGIPLKLYFPGKLLQCFISLLLSSLMQLLLPFLPRTEYTSIVAVWAMILIIVSLLLLYSKIIVAFWQKLMYNQCKTTTRYSHAVSQKY